MARWIKTLLVLGSGLSLALVVIAASADVMVVVSAQNPTEALSRSELSDMYLGRRQSFPNGERVVVLDQREGSDVHRAFYREFLGQTPAQIKRHWSRLIFTGRGQPPRTVSGDESMAEWVADDPSAIGYVNSGLVDERLRVVRIE